MTFPFQDKIILITGAASGIGRGTAIKLASLGATLCLTDINNTGLLETLSLCQSSNTSEEQKRKHFTSAFDVGSSAACNGFVSQIVLRFEHINHVFNCAGINPTALATAEISDDYFSKMISCNITGLFNITRACIPHMPSHSDSTFVNVSSICGTSARAGFAVYCATKFAIIGFSKSMALELGPRGIRTNVVAPGYIDTPTNAGVVEGEEGVRKMREGNALGRVGSVGEVVDVVVFLMGEGSRYMNGSVVDVDGGIGRMG